MKKIFLILSLFFLATSCNLVGYNDINKYQGNVIKKIEPDSIGTIKYYRFYIKDENGKYNTIILKFGMGDLFSVGDTI